MELSSILQGGVPTRGTVIDFARRSAQSVELSSILQGGVPKVWNCHRFCKAESSVRPISVIFFLGGRDNRGTCVPGHKAYGAHVPHTARYTYVFIYIYIYIYTHTYARICISCSIRVMTLIGFFGKPQSCPEDQEADGNKTANKTVKQELIFSIVAMSHTGDIPLFISDMN